jgi:hypothetical protein
MIKALTFLRLIDENGELSLTNLAVIAALINVALQFDVDVYDVVALGITLASYQFKRTVLPKKAAPKEELQKLQDQMAQLESKLTAIVMGRKLS